MKKNQQALRRQVDLDNLVAMARKAFAKLPDPRGRGCKYALDDVMMSALAMFVLKYPSLLQFEDQTQSERANLHRIFGIKNICSDAQMRSILDQINPDLIRGLYPQYFALLRRTGIVKEYIQWNKQMVVSVDGVEHFHSSKIHCPYCQQKHHSNGELSYSHSMLAAVLVHQDHREVFPLGGENITRQDGSNKNDGEHAAAGRLLNWMIEHYGDQNLLLVQDALFANAPYLGRILDQGWDFVVSVKPGSHKLLFRLFETRRQEGAVRYHEYPEGKLKHRFWYCKDMPLNDAASHFRVNVLHYEEENAKGKIRRFTWATSIKPNKANVSKLMRIGRSRWKIENETFNTLKNLGYHFEHNYGHGFKHLASLLALLMLLAFLIDQIFQKSSQVFNRIWQASSSKAKLWNVMRAAFTIQVFNSFNELYRTLAIQFEVQLE
jgi:hypothetical protein